MTVTVFGYVIWISIDFYNFIFQISPYFSFRLRGYIKHSRPFTTTFLPTSKFLKNILSYASYFQLPKCGQTRCCVFDILLQAIPRTTPASTKYLAQHHAHNNVNTAHCKEPTENHKTILMTTYFHQTLSQLYLISNSQGEFQKNNGVAVRAKFQILLPTTE